MKAKAIQTNTYFDANQIKEHLENVEYIIMAAPAPDHFKQTPIHFTIFLNTTDNFPKDIQEEILNKFLSDNNITKPSELLSQIMPVAFAKSVQDTPMPMLLVKRDDVNTIVNTPLFVMDFLADSDNFTEVKQKQLTGWSYSYNE